MTRLLTRYLRVLAACLALGLVLPPLALAAPPAVTIAWIAGTRAMVAAAADASNPQPAAREAPAIPTPARRNIEAVHNPPAGVRAIVIVARLYLRHEALLR